jgi:hypothetical protein
MRDNLGAAWTVFNILLGLALVFGGAALLFHAEQERRLASMSQDEFAKTAITIEAGKIDPKNQGKPVVVTGMLTCDTKLEDPDLGAKFPGAILADRKVLMYQNDEVWVGSGDDERFAGHTQLWSEEAISCPSKPNPPMPLAPRSFFGENYKVGKFTIPKEMATDLDGQTVHLPSIKLPSHLANLGDWKAADKFYEMTTNRPGAAGIGNLRLSYLVLEPIEVTVMGAQQGDRIEPFIDGAGGQTYLIRKGRVDVASLGKTAPPVAGMGGPRAAAAIPLWLGLWILLYLKYRKQGGCLSSILAALAVPLVMVLVHQVTWKVVPHLVI